MKVTERAPSEGADKIDTGWSAIDLNSAAGATKVEFEIEGAESQQRAANGQEEKEVAAEKKVEAIQPSSSDIEDASNETGRASSSNENLPKELDGIETRGAQKRIRQLIKQRKERDEQIEKLREEVYSLKNYAQNRDKELASSIKTTIDTTESQLKARLASAKELFKRAAENSDTDAMLRAQEEMSAAYSESTLLAQRKKALEDYDETLKQQQVKQQAQQQQQSASQPKYDPKAIQWASKNEWFGKDQIMTNAALSIDAQLKEEGFDPSDDEYYSEVDQRLKEQFPHRFGSQKAVDNDEGEEEIAPKAAQKPSQVVAGASRTPRTSQTSKGNKVKLTQEDVRLAQKWGIPLEVYAAEKLKAEQANGEYTLVQ
jgi:hypothetical protein